ncbi:MAG: hypothetical protein WCG80_14490 [Spirochaetales bacterium]
MTVKATQFRQNLFQILDQCRDTGEKVRIERGTEVYELVPSKKRIRIQEIPDRPWIYGVDPDRLHLVKTSEWTPDDLS